MVVVIAGVFVKEQILQYFGEVSTVLPNLNLN